MKWRALRESFARPYRPPIGLFVLIALVPLYVFIPVFVPEMPWFKLHTPGLLLDRLFPLQPVWAIVYGALYAFLILLPLFAVRESEHVKRTVRAYLFCWITAYLFFIFYPTVAPRPPHVAGQGFLAAGLRFLYDSDPPFNCFPSLHVAHSMVSALALKGVNRSVGRFSLFAAGMVALSTLFTKQHYVADVVAGIVLAGIAWRLFLRTYDTRKVPDGDRAIASMLAVGAIAFVGLAISCYWVGYKLGWIF